MAPEEPDHTRVSLLLPWYRLGTCLLALQFSLGISVLHGKGSVYARSGRAYRNTIFQRMVFFYFSIFICILDDVNLYLSVCSVDSLVSMV